MPITIEELRARIKRVVLVMMENRSFDHVLGYLSLPGVQPPVFKKRKVDGLISLNATKDYSKLEADVRNNLYRNRASGNAHFPHHMRDYCPTDLPHSRDAIGDQINGGAMDGFVSTYAEHTNTAMEYPDPMGFMTRAELPISDFLARQFAVCDRWHSPIPADTQPNKLMAYCGYTDIDKGTFPTPAHQTLFDWLDHHQITWRVYCSGLSFFTLMPSLWPRVFSGRFKSLDQLRTDLRTEKDSFPQVVLVEPSYTSDPFHDVTASDNHPPAPMSSGETFLASVYRALASEPDVFAQSVWVIAYDEHGGFYDHVPPPAIATAQPATGNWKKKSAFTTLGVRVPAFLVSPYVPRAKVSSALCDHTSILQLLADLHDKGDYSKAVADRLKSSAANPIQSLSAVLCEILTHKRRTLPDPPAVPLADIVAPPRAPKREMDKRFAEAARQLEDDPQYSEIAFRQYPELEQFL